MRKEIEKYIMSASDGAGVYVGTYRKYNGGSLYGAWLDLEMFTDAEDFFDACRQLHSDEEDPEFMFQDFQGFPRELYGESMNEKDVQKILDYLALDDDEREMVEDYIECFGGSVQDFEDIIDKARDNYGKWNTFEDFSDNQADEMLSCYNLPSCVSNYFDYKAFARDLEYDYHFGSNGYVFPCY